MTVRAAAYVHCEPARRLAQALLAFSLEMPACETVAKPMSALRQRLVGWLRAARAGYK